MEGFSWIMLITVLFNSCVFALEQKFVLPGVKRS